jgi:hypothetical protein
MFDEGREVCPLRIRHDLAPFGWWSFIDMLAGRNFGKALVQLS